MVKFVSLLLFVASVLVVKGVTEDRKKVTDVTKQPWNCIGLLMFRRPLTENEKKKEENKGKTYDTKLCTASLISFNHIFTAAHCISSDYTGALFITTYPNGEYLFWRGINEKIADEKKKEYFQQHAGNPATVILVAPGWRKYTEADGAIYSSEIDPGHFPDSDYAVLKLANAYTKKECDPLTLGDKIIMQKNTEFRTGGYPGDKPFCEMFQGRFKIEKMETRQLNPPSIMQIHIETPQGQESTADCVTNYLYKGAKGQSGSPVLKGTSVVAVLSQLLGNAIKAARITKAVSILICKAIKNSGVDNKVLESNQRCKELKDANALNAYDEYEDYYDYYEDEDDDEDDDDDYDDYDDDDDDYYYEDDAYDEDEDEDDDYYEEDYNDDDDDDDNYDDYDDYDDEY